MSPARQPATRRVVMALFFFPRGGSAYVARHLARLLPAAGWDVTLVQFGQVLVEAMACGLPVVAVDAHGPATIVEQGRTGWLGPPDDLEALAAALVAAVNDPAGRARMGDAGWHTSRARYSLEAVVAGVAGAYEQTRTAHPRGLAAG